MKKKNIAFIILILVGIALITYGVIKNFSNEPVENNKPKEEETDNKETDIFSAYYDNMKTGNTMKGYYLSVKLLSYSNTGSILENNSELVIENYMDRSYRISKNNKEEEVENTLYIVNDRVYIFNEIEEKYEITNQKPVCNNTQVFMETLKNVKEIINEENIIIDSEDYKKYTYITTKEIVNELLKTTTLKDEEIKEDVEVVLIINSKGYIQSIEYNLGKLFSEDVTMTLEINIYVLDEPFDFESEIQEF